MTFGQGFQPSAEHQAQRSRMGDACLYPEKSSLSVKKHLVYPPQTCEMPADDLRTVASQKTGFCPLVYDFEYKLCHKTPNKPNCIYS